MSTSVNGYWRVTFRFKTSPKDNQTYTHVQVSSALPDKKAAEDLVISTLNKTDWIKYKSCHLIYEQYCKSGCCSGFDWKPMKTEKYIDNKKL